MLSNIEAERARHSMSQAQLAQKMGITRWTYSKWVHEQTDIPASALIQMSKLFGVTTDYLLEGAEGITKDLV